MQATIRTNRSAALTLRNVFINDNYEATFCVYFIPRDAILTSLINCLTSFLAGFVIFSVLGYMALVQNKSIDKVGLEGEQLIHLSDSPYTSYCRKLT
jgi:hypothetical protein